MDVATIGTAWTGLKAAMEMLQGVMGAKIDAASLGKITEAMAKLAQAQDVIFEMREEMFALQQKNQELSRKVAEQEEWRSVLQAYELVTTDGGATVYKSTGIPAHFVCPSCINRRELHILQDTNTVGGRYSCPGCQQLFQIKPAKNAPINYRISLG